MNALTRPPFTRDEALLIERADGSIEAGFGWVAGILELASLAIDYEAVKIIRFDRAALRGEDITESVAEAWFAANRNVEFDDLPPFVVATSVGDEIAERDGREAAFAPYRPTLTGMNRY